ncbi:MULTISPECIES: DUF4136 domain-containing protein [Marinobacter]|uniref:DUF4136 domain-containing protein n=1 Tax=Marinobacter profundi TaxID=2666256 RepID=A0A2G1UMD3_9GAMM|nr:MULTISPECIES: DUF4136 domain-containing protein [Marinobacter]MBD3655149.1 DUF4136 domain-containing protein [Marinobacter sp.]PHQ15589.1 hypothetical protein CLH61_07940 [Marinobacter profundi]
MRIWITVLMLLMLGGCASNVVTDYDSTTVFGNYTTWSFAGDNSQQGFLSLDGARVESAVEREMNRKAMRRVDAGDADLLVAYRVVKEERLEQIGVGFGLGFGHDRFGWGLASAPPVREIEEGKLVVELVDNQTERVVWRAASRRYLNEDQSPEYRRELIDEVVAEMFTKYPPGIE